MSPIAGVLFILGLPPSLMLSLDFELQPHYQVPGGSCPLTWPLSQTGMSISCSSLGPPKLQASCSSVASTQPVFSRQISESSPVAPKAV